MQVPTTTEINALDARRQFGELMNRAYYGGESFIVKRDNLPMIKIEPVYSTQEKEQARQAFFAVVDQVRQKLTNQNSEAVEQAFDEALESARTASNA